MRAKLRFVVFLGTILVLALPALNTLSRPVVQAQGPANPLICYSVADGGDRLHWMNRFDGTQQFAAPNTTTPAQRVEGIELNLDNSILWGVDDDTDAGGAGVLGVINQLTGSWTAIGAIGTGNHTVLGPRNLGDGDGLSIDARTNKLWALEQTGGIRNNAIYQINPASGAYVPNVFGAGQDYAIIDMDPATLGPCAGSTLDCTPGVNCPNTIDDLGIHPDTGVFYAIFNDITNVTVDWLALIDVNGETPGTNDGYDAATGLVSACLVGILNDGTNNVTDMEGFGVFNDGTFYGTTGSESAIVAQRNTMWSVDETNARVTLIGTFASDTDFESVACLTAGANTLSGTVFCEPATGYDGVFNAGDSVQPGATLRLYEDLGTIGALDGADRLLQTTTADGSGNYSFQVGVTGNFLIEMDGAILPAGSIYTTPTATGNVNTASFGDYNLADSGNAFGFTCQAVGTTSDLSIAKSDSPDPVTPGATITYAIDVRNDTTVAATNGVMNDTLPAGTTFVSLSSPAGWSCTTPAVGSGGTVACANPSVAPGGPYAFSLVVTVPADYSGPNPIPNTATTGADNDSNPANNTAQTTTALQAASGADLAVTKGDSPDPVTPGGTITYTIVVTNVGNADATNATLSDPLPAGTTFTSLAPAAGWACSTPAVGAGGSLSCATPSVAVSTSHTFTLVVTVPAAYSGPNPIPNTATIGADNDSNPANNTAQATTALTAPQVADLAVAKSDSPDPVTPGGEIIYTISVANVGGVTATNATLTDDLPAGTTFVSLSSAAGWSCTTPAVGSGGGINCTNPAVASGGPYPFTLIVAVPVGYSGPNPIPNTAAVGASNDSNPNNNRASVTTGLPGAPGVVLVDPALSKVGILESGGLGVIGEQITWVITATNPSSTAIANVVVSDTIRNDMRIDSASAAVGTASVSGQTVTFSIGTMSPGQSVRLQIVTTIISGPNLPIPNLAVLTADPDKRLTAYAEVFGFPTRLPATGYPPRQ